MKRARGAEAMKWSNSNVFESGWQQPDFLRKAIGFFIAQKLDFLAFLR
jgi:hypothetical protein